MELRQIAILIGDKEDNIQNGAQPMVAYLAACASQCQKDREKRIAAYRAVFEAYSAGHEYFDEGSFRKHVDKYFAGHYPEQKAKDAAAKAATEK